MRKVKFEKMKVRYHGVTYPAGVAFSVEDEDVEAMRELGAKVAVDKQEKSISDENDKAIVDDQDSVDNVEDEEEDEDEMKVELDSRRKNRNKRGA